MTATSLETTFQMIPFCNKFKIVNEYLEANCVFRKVQIFSSYHYFGPIRKMLKINRICTQHLSVTLKIGLKSLQTVSAFFMGFPQISVFLDTLLT